MLPRSLPDKMLRAGLTLAFLYFGLTKLTGTGGTIELYEALGFGQFPRFVTGTSETGGAIGLWIGGVIGLAGAVLTVTMIIGLMAMLIFIGGAWWHLALLLVLSAVVAWTWRADLRRVLPI